MDTSVKAALRSRGAATRHRIRTHPGATFFEIPVPAWSAVHGHRVREFHWPEKATLVSVRRGERVIVPHGDTGLETGDAITAFGTSEARVEFANLLEPVLEPGEPPQ